MEAIFRRAPERQHSPEIQKQFKDILTEEKVRRRRKRVKGRSMMVKSTLDERDDLSIFSTDSGRVEKEKLAKGMVPKIIERMNLPPITEKSPLINIITPKNP
jgi:hypothetical protein